MDLAAIGETYEEGQTRAVWWCPGPKLLADPLTKDNGKIAALLIDVIRTGIHHRPREIKVNLGHP